MTFSKTIVTLGATALASLLLILLGIAYYMITIFIIKTGASWAGYTNLDAGTAVLTAGIVTAAAIVGSAIQQ